MKQYIAFIIAVFFASSALAQDTIQQQLPPSVQTDTTSGWQLVFSNPNYGANNHTIDGLQFISQPENKIIYAGASNGSANILLKSTDLGVTWDSLPTPVPGGPVVFTTSLVGYAGTGPDAKVVWKTTDGGQSWTQHARNSVATGPIAFANQDTGLVFGPCCTARTTDAGNTWNEIFTLNDVDKNAASFANSQVGYAVGNTTGIPSHPTSPYAGFCEKTIDGGATWTQIYTGVQIYILCCQAIDENTLYAAGTGNGTGSYFIRTSNSGISWDTLFLGNSNTYFPAMSFADSLHGIVVGGKSLTQGIILATSDAGKTWQTQYAPNIPVLRSAVMLNDTVAIICGDGNIYRTSTSGNFSSVSQQNINFQIQIFPNPSTGIITIQYLLPSASTVSYQIYNIQGIQVGAMNLGMQNTGTQQTSFDGSALPNGAYYLNLIVGANQQTIPFSIQKT